MEADIVLQDLQNKREKIIDVFERELQPKMLFRNKRVSMEINAIGACFFASAAHLLEFSHGYSIFGIAYLISMSVFTCVAVSFVIDILRIYSNRKKLKKLFDFYRELEPDRVIINHYTAEKMWQTMKGASFDKADKDLVGGYVADLAYYIDNME